MYMCISYECYFFYKFDWRCDPVLSLPSFGNVSSGQAHVPSSQINYQGTFCWIPSTRPLVSSARQLQFRWRTSQRRKGRSGGHFSFLFVGVGMLGGGWREGGVAVRGAQRPCGPSPQSPGIITHSLSAATRPSPLLPPTFPFHPRPTFLGGGGGCRCTGAELGVRSTI